MKLLSKYSGAYILVAIPLFLITSVVYYYLTLEVISNQADESLKEDKSYIIEQLDESDEIIDMFLNLSDDYHLRETTVDKAVTDQFSTIMLYDNREQEEEPYRQLYTSINKNGEFYELTIRKSLVEYNSLVYTIIVIGIVFLGFLTLSFALINSQLAGKIWKPFYEALNKLKDYKVETNEVLLFNHSSIEEFQELNSVISAMTSRIQRDFTHQKQFSDNVAHEIQTPLAVINANMDILIQNENLGERELEVIQSITDSSLKLSRINKSLLLLSKIENNRFQEKVKVDLKLLVTNYLKVFDDQLKENDIKVVNELERSFYIEIHSVLAEVLISNLLQNAIRHNIKKGVINISFDENTFEIANTGRKTKMAPHKLMEKFVKSPNQPDSTGLGLSIVKQICEKYDISLNYRIEGNIHIVNLLRSS